MSAHVCCNACSREHPPCLPAAPAAAPQGPHKGSSSSRCHWKVYYPEQLIAKAGSAVSAVIVITKGAVRMRFPPGAEGPKAVKEHTVVASVGESHPLPSTPWCTAFCSVACWCIV